MKTVIGVAAWVGGTIVFTTIALILVRNTPVVRDWAGLIPPHKDFVAWARARMGGIGGGASDEDTEEAA